MCCVVLGVPDGVRESGFTIRRFTHTGVVSVQCNCQQLPKHTNKVLSINLQHYVSVSESLPVASLYPDGESQMIIDNLMLCETFQQLRKIL